MADCRRRSHARAIVPTDGPIGDTDEMTNLRRRRVADPLDAVLFLLPVAVGGATGALTAGSIRSWYRTLDKPAYNPPDAVFGPTWTVLYASMGAALVMLRRAGARGADDEAVRTAALAFAVQLTLNAGWSLIFFNGRSIGGALLEIVALWLAVAATVGAFARVRPAAGIVLVPYLGWVTFATVLNAGIWRMNR
jgi:tryptophan-rich sensory protein